MDFGKLLGGVNADDIADVVRLVIDNREVIAKLGQLPELFDSIASSLSAAGTEAQGAALALVGSDGSSGARGALHEAASALSGIVDSLGKGIDLIEATAEKAHKVPLMDGPADSLGEAAGQMRHSTDQLGALAHSMTSIADVLAQVSSALSNVGKHLSDTGSEAHGFLAAPN